MSKDFSEEAKKIEELEARLPDEFKKVLDFDNMESSQVKAAFDVVMTIDNEQAHKDCADAIEIAFVESFQEVVNDPELEQVVELMKSLGSLVELFGAADAKETAAVTDAMQSLAHVAKYVYDIKGANTDPLILSYIGKLSLLTDEEYNSPVKMMMAFVEAGSELKKQKQPVNPFRPAP